MNQWCVQDWTAFSRPACINPPGPTHINSEYICTVYHTLRKNCCPPIMEKRLSYKKPKPHHFYTLYFPGRDVQHCAMAVDVSLLSTTYANWCQFSRYHVVEWWIVHGYQLGFFYNIVLAEMYGGMRSWGLKWLKNENGGHEIQSPDARKYNVCYYCTAVVLTLLSQAVSL